MSDNEEPKVVRQPRPRHRRPKPTTAEAPATESAATETPASDASDKPTGEPRRRPPRRRSPRPKPEGEVAGADTAPAPEPAEPAASEADPDRKPRSRGRRGGAGRRKPATRPDGEQAAEGTSEEKIEAPKGEAASDDVGAAPRPVRKRRRTGRRPRPDDQIAPPSGPRTMLITVGKQRHQIAVLEKRELVEHYVAGVDDRSLVGNVYMGRVQNVLPGMEAAFLDIGESRNAVLYAGEVGFDEEIEGPRPRIETMLKSGQPVLAQVTKDPMGAKGARLTTEISIAGRYIVLVPGADFVGISRRLPDDERVRLRDITSRLRPKGTGAIVRTAAEGVSDEDIERDLQRLARIWGEIERKAKKSKPPKLLHAEPDLAIRVVRDLFTTDVEKVIVDDKTVYDELHAYIEELTPSLLERLELYQGSLALFEEYHVIEQIRKAVDRKVWLKSGGHIVIDRTEALTVIDVNTGRFVGKSTLEETVLQANLEAADEVAKQLRLRDIGGIIVIDFIDMMHERNRDELLRSFRSALARDKTRTQVFGVSELGTVQMTRKKISEGLLEAFSHKCEACDGRGIILTDLD